MPIHTNCLMNHAFGHASSLHIIKCTNPDKFRYMYNMHEGLER